MVSQRAPPSPVLERLLILPALLDAGGILPQLGLARLLTVEISGDTDQQQVGGTWVWESATADGGT